MADSKFYLRGKPAREAAFDIILYNFINHSMKNPDLKLAWIMRAPMNKCTPE